MRVLVTGATGYIGGRLVPRLLDQGHQVRVLVRDPRRIAGRRWVEQVEVATGDVVTGEGLREALAGVDSAAFLVHSMTAAADFAERDRRAAQAFVAAAAELPHVIYLGGLLPEARASRHLASRAEVGEILRAGLPATEFRAGPVIGSGSASFEMVRYLTERLPVMVTPHWISNPVSPIAVDDALAYLVAAIERGPSGIVEIGGVPLTFRQMMLEYAAVRDLRRHIFATPVLAPRLAARWVGLVTPIPNRLAVPLIEGVSHPIVADTTRAREVFPLITLMPYRRAVELALEVVERSEVETHWSGALGSAPTVELSDREGLIREVRTRHVDAPPVSVFAVFSSLGGNR
ncbi:MAG TPA: NAD(P)H-binding protein, partial [Thermoanaerobaculaceae bacterium]|nr:NAD(P)H-binding protein [Thermoanaerobaculaceae bacterium]